MVLRTLYDGVLNCVRQSADVDAVWFDGEVVKLSAKLLADTKTAGNQRQLLDGTIF